MVIVKNEPDLGTGTVSYIQRSSVYYEARPIASYDEFTIYVRFLRDENRMGRQFKIKDLELAP